MSEERSESLQAERRNCEKCGSAKKEVMLLTSSVFECVNSLCGNEYVEAKDGVDFQVISSLSLQEGETVKVCLSCGYAYGNKSVHFCGPTKAAPTVTATQAKQRLQSVAPLHLQAWRTLDEIYKEVGSFPFTIQSVHWNTKDKFEVTELQSNGYYKVVQTSISGLNGSSGYDGISKYYKLVSVP